MRLKSVPSLVLVVVLVMAGACRRLADKFLSKGTDSVNVASIDTGQAIVVANGHRADSQPCQRGYELSVASPTAQFGNFLAAPPCEADIAAFGKGRGMGFEDASQKWTDNPGDQVGISLAPRLSQIPLNIFILSGDQYTDDPSKSVEVRRTSAGDDVTRALQMYDDYMTGISFSVTQVVDETMSQTFSADLLTADCNDVGRFGQFKAVDPEKTAVKGINVFYSDGQDGYLGQTCHENSNFASIVIVISQGATGDILAHELGHALLSKDHYNPYGVPLDNLMMSPTSYPASLTIGQAFRMNLNAVSILNTGGFRMGPTKTCPDSAGAPNCPDITLRPQP
jgi:hypothetical protein